MTDVHHERTADSTTATLLEEVLDEYETFTDRRIDRSDYTSLKRAISTDAVTIAESDRSFFVVGSYGADEGDRLRLVADRLNSTGRSFLLKDLEAFDSLLLWTTQFKVMAKRSTHVVGVYEHSDGGHEWEAGWLDHEPYRDKLTVFKRDYPDLDDRDEPFDGMFAHFLESMAALEQCYRFEASSDAPNREVEQEVLTCVRSFKQEELGPSGDAT